ncbi:MAG: 2-amino-4-hydroxy-6-hydroxymethyldihydropteridine diphosphokinase [Campylobacterota bacterium]|nr:2-amino-4-hydroxy-6-hydroxymethyldihydropteridine diphosphokinase [Campylobacterota bacterium]
MPIKHRINSELTLFSDRCFPARFAVINRHRYRAVLGIGGNIGDVRRRFIRLIHFLKRDNRVTLIETAPILKNPPFGFIEQEDFLNSVLEVSTSMQAKEFLRYILHVEKKFGRKRSFADAPRTLDIDMIFFDSRVIQSKELTLPHPSWQSRESVIIPLSFLGRC